MSSLAAFLWGLFGGFAVESLDFSKLVRNNQRPWRPVDRYDIPFLAASVVFRLLLGAFLAVAARQSDQIGGPMGAIAIGVAAPLFLEQLARQVTIVPDPSGPSVFDHTTKSTET